MEQPASWAGFISASKRSDKEKPRGPEWASRGSCFWERRGPFLEPARPQHAITSAYYFFLGGTIESFAALATRNFTTFLAGILMLSPVAGLRPVRALRSTRTSLPVLSNVLLATDGNRLRLSATNLEIGINYWLGSKVEDQGSVTVPARLFAECVSSLPHGILVLGIILLLILRFDFPRGSRSRGAVLAAPRFCATRHRTIFRPRHSSRRAPQSISMIRERPVDVKSNMTKSPLFCTVFSDRTL